MKFLIYGVITGILGLVAIFLAAYLAYSTGRHYIIEAVSCGMVGVALFILGFKTIVWAVLKLNHF